MSEEHKELFSEIDSFLADKREDYDGDLTKVKDEDVESLRSILCKLIDAKFGSAETYDCNPIEFRLVNSGTHRLSGFEPIPTSPRCTLEEYKRRFRWAMYNMNVAYEELRIAEGLVRYKEDQLEHVKNER